MATQQRQSLGSRLERIVSFSAIPALLLAAWANLLIWQQNSLNERTARPNVVVFSTSNIGYDFDVTDAAARRIGCVERIRFNNSGGKADFVVGFDTEVLYQNTRSVLIGGDKARNSYNLMDPSSRVNTYQASPQLIGAALGLSVIIAPDESFSSATPDIKPVKGNAPAIGIPYKLDGPDSKDVEAFIGVTIAPNRHWNLFYEPGRALITSEPTDLPELSFELLFRLSSGKVERSPRFTCGAIG